MKMLKQMLYHGLWNNVFAMETKSLTLLLIKLYYL